MIYIIDFVVATLLYNLTKILFFIVEIGYKPCTSFDWDYLENLINIINNIYKVYTKAKSRVEKIYNI